MNNNLRNEFGPLVREHFGFLEKHGFQFSEVSKPLYVIFESSKLELLICLDPSRGELELGFSRAKQNSPTYGLGELIKVQDAKTGAGYRDPIVRTKEQLEAELREFARLLQIFGARLLSGDLEDLIRIDQERQRGLLQKRPQ